MWNLSSVLILFVTAFDFICIALWKSSRSYKELLEIPVGVIVLLLWRQIPPFRGRGVLVILVGGAWFHMVMLWVCIIIIWWYCVSSYCCYRPMNFSHPWLCLNPHPYLVLFFLQQCLIDTIIKKLFVCCIVPHNVWRYFTWTVMWVCTNISVLVVFLMWFYHR